jgi:hypothetical protein
MSPSYKTIFEAADLLQIAQAIALNALEAANHCDAVRARRLRKRALKAALKAEAKLATATPEERAFYYTDDVVVRQLKSLRKNMNLVNRLLAICSPQTKYPFKASGSFAKSKDLQAGQAGKNRIDFHFALAADPKCERLCLVSVYYLEENATGKKAKKPSDGYKPGFDNLYGGTLPDRDAADGYIVDAPAMVPAPGGGLQFVPSNSPCMPSSKVAGLVVTGLDKPNFVKRGYTAHFETCLVCLDDRPKFRVLGCIKWFNRRGKAKIVPSKGKFDRNGVSEGFVRALEKYLVIPPLLQNPKVLVGYDSEVV